MKYLDTPFSVSSPKPALYEIAPKLQGYVVGWNVKLFNKNILVLSIF